MIRTPDEIDAEARRLVGMGRPVAGRFLANAIREVISVPAPRRIVTSRRGVKYYRATVPATPGAPPRKLSGRLRAAVASWEPDENTTRVGVQKVVYGRPLEVRMNHPYLEPTLQANMARIGEIIGSQFSTGSNLGN